MKILRRTFAFLLVASIASTGSTREPKEYDNDVNYDEVRIPHYDLPPLLLSAEEKQITTADEWRTIRRPQIVSLFSNLIYGRVPAPADPIKTEFSVLKEDESFMDDKAIRKDVRIRFSNKLGTVDMHVLVFVPNGTDKPVPCFLKHSFNNTKSNDFDASETQAGRL